VEPLLLLVAVGAAGEEITSGSKIRFKTQHLDQLLQAQLGQPGLVQLVTAAAAVVVVVV
jgi:hypothetical protein